MRALIVGGVALVALCAAAAIAGDARLQRDVRELTPERGLDLVMALQPVSFWWSEDEVVFPQGGRNLGLTAQEVVEVLPEVVDDNGGVLYVDYDGITAVIVAATQQQQALLVEQAALIEAQQLEIDELRDRLDALEATAP